MQLGLGGLARAGGHGVHAMHAEGGGGREASVVADARGLHGHGLAHDGAATSQHLQLGDGATAGRGRRAGGGRHGPEGSSARLLHEGAHGLGLTQNGIHILGLSLSFRLCASLCVSVGVLMIFLLYRVDWRSRTGVSSGEVMFLCGTNSGGKRFQCSNTPGERVLVGFVSSPELSQEKNQTESSTERASAEGGGKQEALVEAKSIPKAMPLEGSDRQQASRPRSAGRIQVYRTIDSLGGDGQRRLSRANRKEQNQEKMKDTRTSQVEAVLYE